MPLWMVALWLMFATVWTQLTRTTTLPGWLLTLLATVGGPDRLSDRRTAWCHYFSGADLYCHQLDGTGLAGIDAVFPSAGGETKMRAAALLLWLIILSPVAQAADWLTWRKVGDATLTWGPFTDLYLTASHAGGALSVGRTGIGR